VPDRLIGDAYIAILPDVSQFRTRGAAEINAALAGQRFSVKVTGDFGDVDKKVAALAAALKGLNGQAKIDLNTKQAIRDIAGLEAAIVGLWDRLDNIPVDLNDSKGLAKLYGLRSASEALAKQLEDLGDADFDINKALSKFYTLEAGAKSLQEQVSHLDANINDAAANAKFAEMGGAVRKLSDQLDNMRANVNNAAGLAKIVAMQAAALKLAHQLNNMPVTADTLPFQASLYKLAAQVEAFKKTLDAKISPQVVLPLKPGAYQTYGMGGLSPAEAQMMDALTTKTLDAMTAFKGLNLVMADNSAVASRVAAGLAKIGATQSMIIAGNGAGWWGALTTRVRLFGGALDNILPKMLTSVSVWHIAADVILEFAAAWGPAIIAVGTFAAYAYPVGEKIYSQWKNINTILDGVGGRLPDLGSSFDTIERAIEPSILEAFGEYMMIIGKNAEPLGAALAKVGAVVDVWGAKLVGWASSAQKSFDNIVAVGAKDFAEIGYGFEQVFRIIGSLIKDLPGYVHILLLVGDAILTLAANAVAAAAPLLKAGLALHGFLIYVGLAVTAVVALGRAMAAGALASYAARTGTELAAAGTAAEEAGGKFNKFGTAIGGFAGAVAAGGVNLFKYGKNVATVASDSGKGAAAAKILRDGIALLPDVLTGAAGAAGLAAVAFGAALYFGLHNASNAAKDFGVQMQKLIASSNASNIAQNLSVALTQTSDKYAQVTRQLNSPLPTAPIAQYNKALQSIPQNVSTVQQQAVKTILNSQQQLTNAQARQNQVLQKSNPYSTNRQEQQIYLQQIQQIIGETQIYGSRMAQLSQVFGSTAAAQNALTLAGVSQGQVATETNKAWATQLIELEGLAKGYGYMGSQAGAAGAQLNALNISTGTTYKNVQALTQAESGWISLITGGESAFTAFEQGFPNLTSAMGKTSAGAATVSVTVGKLNERFTALGGTMAGTSASSLAVRQAFDSQLSAGVTLFGNLQTLATASGNTSGAQIELARASKDIIAQMLPFAAGSKQATAELSSLAQLMGGPATDNFQVLAKWVGNTKGAEADLNNEQAKLTISSANLTTAAKNLGNALDTMVTQDEAAAIAKTANLTGATQGLATAAANAKGKLSAQAVTMAGEYVAALTKTGMGQQQATQYLNAYLKQLGYGPQAIALIDANLKDSVAQWNKVDSAVAHNTAAQAALTAATKTNAGQFQTLNGILPGTSKQFGELWQAILKQDNAMVQSGKSAEGSKTQFIDFAVNGLRLTQGQANALWQKFGQQNLDTMGTKAGATKQQFIQFAMNGLHLTTTQAQTLWGEFALQNLDEMASKGNKTKNQFIQLAKNGLDLTTSAANNLWTTLTHQYLDTVAHKAGETQQAFIKTAGQFGITTQAAKILWQQLRQIPANVHTNVSETLSGSGQIKAAITAQSLTLSSTGAATQAANLVGVAAPHKAGGGLVRGGIHGQDSELTMLAPGELVIPSTHAASHMVQAKREGILGMAAGGVVNGTPQATLANVQQGISTAQSAIGQFTSQAMTQWISQLNTAFSNAQAAAGSKYNGPASFGGGFESLAALVAFARYFMQNGLNRAAAAGMAATISGEEDAAGPESVGSGGFGLIGWTGNTIGLPAGYHGPTGNVAYDLAAQLAGVIGYMNSRGGAGPLNAAGNPVAAGDVWSRYEAPLVPLSDTRPGVANAIYAALGGTGNAYTTIGSSKNTAATGVSSIPTLGHRLGGIIKPHSGGGMVSEPVYGIGLHSGTPYSFAENGQPEYVGPISGGGAQAAPGMQGATNIGQQTLISQNNMMIKLLQQLPYVLGQSIGSAGGNGVKHGYYGAQN
jgi:hypothetical protein